MSKARLQVLMDPEELSEIQRAARRHRMTVAEWVRQALRDARRQESARDPDTKLKLIRNAYAYQQAPVGDVPQRLSEIDGQPGITRLY